MKKLLVVGTIVLSLALTGCNAGSRHFGGTINIDLPKNQKLITATWKEDSLWYLTKPMNNNEIARLLLRVIPRTMRIIRKEIKAATENKLTLLQFRVLVSIIHQGPMSNQEIAAWLDTTPPSMSRIIAILVKNGFIIQKRNLTDRRLVVLDLTEKGRCKFHEITKKAQDSLESEINKLDINKQNTIQMGLSTIEETFLN